MWLKCILRGIVFPPTLGGTVWERSVPPDDVNKWSNRTEELSSLSPCISATHNLRKMLLSNVNFKWPVLGLILRDLLIHVSVITCQQNNSPHDSLILWSRWRRLCCVFPNLHHAINMITVFKKVIFSINVAYKLVLKVFNYFIYWYV